MADKTSAMAAVREGYAASARPLGVARTFDENARGPVRTSDIVISATAISTTLVTLATVPTGENWRIEHLVFRNHTASAANLTVYLVPSGGTAAVSTNGIYAASVAAGAVVSIDGAVGYQLAAGEKLGAISGTATSFIAFGRLTRITQGAT